MPQQLQVRVSELRDVPHEHRQEHHPPAGRPGALVRAVAGWREGLLVAGGLGSAGSALATPPSVCPASPSSWGRVPRPPAPPLSCRPHAGALVSSPPSLGEAAGPGVLRRVRGAGLRGGLPSDSPSPQYCVCVDDCSSSNCMCGQLSMRCWYGKVSPRAGGWGLGARVGAGQGPCPGRVGLGPGRRPQPD